MKKSLLLSHICFMDHGVADHPENAERLRSVVEAVHSSPYHTLLDLTVDRKATPNELLLIHDREYINHILSLDGKEGFLDEETFITPGSVKAALIAAGQGIELIERVIQGKADNGFALVRPPGHHARPSAGMGFCIFNNIAIAARKAIQLGLKRILIFDFDVHLGNGTQESYFADDTVMVIDIHQNNLFPAGQGKIAEIGSGKGLGYTVNIPLPQSSSDADYLYIFDLLVKPLAKEYRPEMILVSAGFDAHESDPLGMMSLTTAGYEQLAARIVALAEELCGGKIVFFLEGGYNPYFLAKNVIACVSALADNKKRDIDETTEPDHSEIIEIRNQVQHVRKKQTS